MKVIVAFDPTAVSKNFRSGRAAAPRLSTILNRIPTLARFDPAEGVSWQRHEDKKSVTKRVDSGVRTLAEAIILQSIEDLWNATHMKESIEFFTGQGFKQCADAAGMSVVDRLRLIRMLRRLDGSAFKSKHAKRIEQLSYK